MRAPCLGFNNFDTKAFYFFDPLIVKLDREFILTNYNNFLGKSPCLIYKVVSVRYILFLVAFINQYFPTTAGKATPQSLT